MSCSLMVWSISSRVGRRTTVALNCSGVEQEPSGDVPDAVLLQIAGGHLAGGRGVLDLHRVAGLDAIARDVEFVPIDADVPVVDELPRGGAGLRQAQKVDHADRAGFQAAAESALR